MKKGIAIALGMAYFLFSCQKYTEPINHPRSSEVDDIVPAVTVVTFAPIPNVRVISTTTPSILFSDSVSVAEDEAVFNGLQFSINGKDLYFGNCLYVVNGKPARASAIYESNLLAIVPDSVIVLPPGNYKLQIIATINCPEQHFKMQLQQPDVYITNYYYNSAAVIYGLPQSYYVRAKNK